MDKKTKKRFTWISILAITILATMYLVGMMKIYMQEPLDVGFGQYFDIGTGVVIVSLLLLGFIVGFVLKVKKIKKHNGGNKNGK